MRRTGHGDQRGGSMVEFAIVAPVLVMLMLYATFFHDALKTKLKAQEAANFAAWELTSFPMSDYGAGGDNGTTDENHQALMDTAKGRVRQDLVALYANLDSANQDPNANTSFIAKHQFVVSASDWASDEEVPFASQDTLRSVPGVGGVGGQAANFLDKGFDFVFNQFKFDRKGLVTVSVDAKFDNVLLPSDFLNSHFHNTKMTPLATITFHEKAALVVDDWAVNNGKDVNLIHAGGRLYGSVGSGSSPHPMAKQVGRMAFLGLPNLVPGLDKFEGFLGNFLPDPLGVPVASYNYYKSHGPPVGYNSGDLGAACTNSSASDYSKHGCIDLRREDRMLDTGIYKMNTAPLRTTFRYDDSPSSQVFNQSGPWYMGCVDPQSPDATQCHHANQ